MFIKLNADLTWLSDYQICETDIRQTCEVRQYFKGSVERNGALLYYHQGEHWKFILNLIFNGTVLTGKPIRIAVVRILHHIPAEDVNKAEVQNFGHIFYVYKLHKGTVGDVLFD